MCVCVCACVHVSGRLRVLYSSGFAVMVAFPPGRVSDSSQHAVEDGELPQYILGECLCVKTSPLILLHAVNLVWAPLSEVSV